jgi:hypothetical protein
VRSQEKTARLSVAGTRCQIDPPLRSQRYVRKQPMISARAVRMNSPAVWSRNIVIPYVLKAVPSHPARGESSLVNIESLVPQRNSMAFVANQSGAGQLRSRDT